MRTIEEISYMFTERKRHQERWVSDAIMLRDLFNGDIDVPLPEMEKNEKAAVANTAVLGLDQMAKRIASTQPNVYFPSVRPGINKSDQLARKRRLVCLSWWHMNKMPLLDRRRARWLVGYGKAPIQIQVDPKLKIPQWVERDPLTTYPAPANYQDSLNPIDCIFAYRKSLAWLTENYPDVSLKLRAQYMAKSDPLKPDTLFDLLEYVDCDERVLGLMGRTRAPWQQDMPFEETSMSVELERVVNRAGICPVVTPSKINIDRVKSDYVSNYGMFIMRAKLMALDYINQERSVFSERWLEEFPNVQNSEILVPADSKLGIVGHTRGGQLKDLQQQMNIGTGQMLDRIERDERIGTGTTASMGGETNTNIRTGRLGSNIDSAAVDFTVQEYQEIIEYSKTQENKIAIRLDKAYLNVQKAYYVGWPSARGEKVDYKPSDTWEMDENFVAFSHAGSDMNNLNIMIGQAIGEGIMSKRTGAETLPLIEDPEREHDFIIAEALESALLQGIAQPGAVPVKDLNFIYQKVKANEMELGAAIDAAEKAAQERQASVQGPQDNAEAQGAQPGTPGAMPGMQPGQPGTQPGVAAIGGPNQSQQNLSDMMNALRRPQRMGPAEQAAVQQAAS